ncbi:MAG TPA: NADH-quinone oxidoreductase subunit J [Rhizomicrobium sp.]|nr:NADH-quinone oxidoreductase subunit J [Rhizomicrobium sp.]
MTLQEVAFGLLALVSVIAALCVVSAKNPVHSVLFLITVFFSAAGMFVLMGAEFLAMLLVVVYVGAVAVLFLFVVMMLDVDFAELKRGSLQYLPFGALIGLILVAELVMVGSVWVLKPAAKMALAHATPAGVTNTVALGRILYTDYVYYFQIAGLVLLVAMIGAIVLTLRSRPGVRRQVIAVQNARTAAMAVDMVDIKPGQGA